jgi:hypothetical protein
LLTVLKWTLEGGEKPQCKAENFLSACQSFKMHETETENLQISIDEKHKTIILAK